MQKIPRVDMGERLPLRHSLRPYARSVVPLAVGVTLLLVLPVAYTLDTRTPLNGLALLFMAVGLLMLYAMIYTARCRISWEITAQAVALRFRHMFRTQASEAPLSEYVALLTPVSREPGFLGTREVKQIVLWHGEAAAKQVTLYAGRDDKVFASRLATYQRLFRLPVNPPGVEVMELPDGMPLPSRPMAGKRL